MPNSIEDKVSLFTKVIIERIELDYKQKKSKLAEYYENQKDGITNEHEEKKKQAVEKAEKEAERKRQQLILKTQSDMHLAVLKKRREFTERLTKEVKKRIRAFVTTDEYTEFLKKAIKQVLSKFNKDQLITLNFSKDDVQNREEMILKTIESVRSKETFQIDAVDDLIGGVFVKSGDGWMEVDFTINDILEESDKLIGEVLSSRLNKEQRDD